MRDRCYLLPPVPVTLHHSLDGAKSVPWLKVLSELALIENGWGGAGRTAAGWIGLAMTDDAPRSSQDGFPSCMM